MNPVLVDLIFIKIYWYSIMILLAFLVGGYVAIREARKHNIDDDLMINFIFFVVPISLLGARIYYIIFNWSHYQGDLFGAFRVWEGGLAIHGGIIFGFLWLLYYVKANDIRLVRFLDIVAPGLLIGQAIGRWGNFFNQEAFGPATTIETLQGYYIPDFIIKGMNIDGVYHHPTFLYEFVWCLIGFLVIILIRATYRYLKVGQIAGLALMWHGVGRYFIEGLRTDSLMFQSLKVAQVMSIVFVIIGFVMFFFIRRGSRFDNLYSEEDEKPGMINKTITQVVDEIEIIEDDIV